MAAASVRQKANINIKCKHCRQAGRNVVSRHSAEKDRSCQRCAERTTSIRCRAAVLLTGFVIQYNALCSVWRSTEETKNMDIGGGGAVIEQYMEPDYAEPP